MKIHKLQLGEQNDIAHLNPCVAIGNFDGVHLGHAEIINQCVSKAKELGVPSGVVFFDPHPTHVLGVGYKKLLTNLEEKTEEIFKLGVENIYIINFTKNLAKLSPQEFVEEVLIRQIGVRHLFTGFNFVFGKNRAGNADFFKKYSNDFAYTIVPEVKRYFFSVSSSKIRELMQYGAVGLAGKLLGRKINYYGKVVEGKKLARQLDAKTANVEINEDKCLPVFGVYVVEVELGNKKYSGVCNIGVKPTFAGDEKPLLEVHIFNFNKDIYGQEIGVNLLQLLRLERKFDNVEALAGQIKRDLNFAQYVYGNIA